MTEQHYIIPKMAEKPVDPELRAAIDSVIAEAQIDTGEILIPPFGFVIAAQDDLEARRKEVAASSAVLRRNRFSGEWELAA